jgi:hypothetical protein
MTKNLWLTVSIVIILISPACGQDMGEIAGQVAQIYTGGVPSQNNFIGGFSLWGLMGGFLFGGIGFVAFVYGKKNSELRPMIFGILLMVYPYFLRGTLALYLVGIGLTTALYIFRE